MSDKIKCPRCGLSQPIGKRFCADCGGKLDGAAWAADSSSSEPGAVTDGVWQRPPEEFVRRVAPTEMRKSLGRRIIQVPQGSFGVVVVDG